MYQAALKTWPMGEHANALNLAANRARYLHYRGNHGSALMAMDAALADAKRWKGQVNGDALASMHYYRVCMLHELGRDDEAARSRAFVVAGRSAVAVAQLNLCLGKHELARDVLIAVVQDEGARQDVIEFVQKSSVPPMQSDYGRKIAARSEALRSDPLLLSEIAKYGRVLPFALSEGAPVELSAAKAL